jgi:hypothetical protein
VFLYKRGRLLPRRLLHDLQHSQAIVSALADYLSDETP